MLLQLVAGEQVFQGIAASSTDDLEDVIARFEALKVSCNAKVKELKEELSTRKSAESKERTKQRTKAKAAAKTRAIQERRAEIVVMNVVFRGIRFSIRVPAGSTVGSVRRAIINKLNKMMKNQGLTKSFSKEASKKMTLVGGGKNLHETTRPELKSFNFDFSDLTFVADLPDAQMKGIVLPTVPPAGDIDPNEDEIDEPEDDEEETDDED
eukprot:Skav220500  [mRNA]  locus=scaffold4697:6197:6826:- [translate_table: standard]